MQKLPGDAPQTPSAKKDATRALRTAEVAPEGAASHPEKALAEAPGAETPDIKPARLPRFSPVTPDVMRNAHSMFSSQATAVAGPSCSTSYRQAERVLGTPGRKQTLSPVTPCVAGISSSALPSKPHEVTDTVSSIVNNPEKSIPLHFNPNLPSCLTTADPNFEVHEGPLLPESIRVHAERLCQKLGGEKESNILKEWVTEGEITVPPSNTMSTDRELDFETYPCLVDELRLKLSRHIKDIVEHEREQRRKRLLAVEKFLPPASLDEARHRIEKKGHHMEAMVEAISVHISAISLDEPFQRPAISWLLSNL